jgi:hypothetical protein
MFTQKDILELEYLLRHTSLELKVRGGDHMTFMNGRWYVSHYDICYNKGKGGNKSFENFHDAISYLMDGEK